MIDLTRARELMNHPGTSDAAKEELSALAAEVERLQAAQAVPAVPEGMVLVPRLPTPEMTRFAEMWDDGFVGAWARAIAVLGAAPKPASVAVPTVAQAMKVVTDALRADPDYAWSWHCNITMAMVDEGLDHALAEHGAQRFLNLLCPGPVLVPAHPLRPKPAQQAGEREAPRLAKELVRLADILRDCGRLVSKSGAAEKIMRDAAEALALSAPASDTRHLVDLAYELGKRGAEIDELERELGLAAPASEQEAEPVATLWREKRQDLYPGPIFDLTEVGRALPLGVKHKLYTHPAQAQAPQAEPVAEFRGRRLTPEGTAEFWGVMLCDPMRDPPKGAKLYLGPVNDPVPSDWRSVIPGGRFTDKGESCRVADFNEGWNAYRKAAIANLAAHRATQQAQATSPVADELLDAYMHACGRSDLAARDEVRRRLAAMLSQQAQASESLIALPPLPAIQTTNVHEQAHIHELREQNTKLREWLTHWRLRAQQFERHFASKQASESAEARDAQIADYLARELFVLGSEGGTSCGRIEFKLGYYGNERPGGGLAEKPLAAFFAKKLAALAAQHKEQT